MLSNEGAAKLNYRLLMPQLGIVPSACRLRVTTGQPDLDVCAQH